MASLSYKLYQPFSKQVTGLVDLLTSIFYLPIMLSDAHRVFNASYVNKWGNLLKDENSDEALEQIGYYCMLPAIFLLNCIRRPVSTYKHPRQDDPDVEWYSFSYLADVVYYNLQTLFQLILLPIFIPFYVGGIVLGLTLRSARDVLFSAFYLGKNIIRLFYKCCGSDIFRDNAVRPLARTFILAGAGAGAAMVLLFVGTDSFFVVGAEFAVLKSVAGLSFMSKLLGLGALSLTLSPTVLLIIGTVLAVITGVIAGKIIGSTLDHICGWHTYPGLDMGLEEQRAQAITEKSVLGGLGTESHSRSTTPTPPLRSSHRDALKKFGTTQGNSAAHVSMHSVLEPSEDQKFEDSTGQPDTTEHSASTRDSGSSTEEPLHSTAAQLQRHANPPPLPVDDTQPGSLVHRKLSAVGQAAIKTVAGTEAAFLTPQTPSTPGMQMSPLNRAQS